MTPTSLSFLKATKPLLMHVSVFPTDISFENSQDTVCSYAVRLLFIAPNIRSYWHLDTFTELYKWTS